MGARKGEREREREREKSDAIDLLNEITVEKVYWLDFCWCTQRNKLSNISMHTLFIQSALIVILSSVGCLQQFTSQKIWSHYSYCIHLMKIKPFRLMCAHTHAFHLLALIKSVVAHSLFALRIGRISFCWIRSHPGMSKYGAPKYGTYTMCVCVECVSEYCTNINLKMNDAENFNSLSQLSPIKVPLNFICY